MNLAQHYLHISTADQKLYWINEGKQTITYDVSTAKKGTGEANGSECTPRGWHKIRAKIGDKQPLNAVFVGRRPTAEIYSDLLKGEFPDRDWILTRILWLAGLEPSKNRYGQVDSSWRYIYIHGCPDELIMGQAESHGCIRMKNTDILDLYQRVSVGLRVFIE
jgi:lipoprotein-anchoring transpeptidase ErfK/SrfK